MSSTREGSSTLCQFYVSTLIHVGSSANPAHHARYEPDSSWFGTPTSTTPTTTAPIGMHRSNDRPTEQSFTPMPRGTAPTTALSGNVAAPVKRAAAPGRRRSGNANEGHGTPDPHGPAGMQYTQPRRARPMRPAQPPASSPSE